jgi:hypothetical protein
MIGNGYAFTPEDEPVQMHSLQGRARASTPANSRSSSPAIPSTSRSPCATAAISPPDPSSTSSSGATPRRRTACPADLHVRDDLAVGRELGHLASPIPPARSPPPPNTPPRPPRGPAAEFLRRAHRRRPRPDAPGRVARRSRRLNFLRRRARAGLLSANSPTPTGFVLYVNGAAALAYQAPAPFTNTPPPPVSRRRRPWQFEVDPNFFKKGQTASRSLLHLVRSSTSAAPSTSASTPPRRPTSSPRRLAVADPEWHALNRSSSAARPPPRSAARCS